MTTPLALLVGAALALALVLAVLVLRSRLASFRAQRPDHYAHLTPAFDLRRHLSGPLLMEGVLYGPAGRVTSRFTATATGTWDGDTGTLAEVFRYDTGRVQPREWRLRLLPGGRIEGLADDVVGTATGQTSGPTVQMRYSYRLPPENGGHVLTVTDWMYLTDGGVILNRSQFAKAGLVVAELVATIRPDPAAQANAEPARSMAAE